MASSEGLSSVDTWSFRQSFNMDSWLNSDSFSHDSDLLAKALHRSISTSTTTDHLSPSAFFDSAAVISDLSPPQTLSNVSFGSDPEIAAGLGGGGAGGAKRKRGAGLGVSGGKPTKRRSRVSTKKSQTTFITADAANFRQMVQQVTGAKYIGASNNIFSPIVKPEPHRLASRLPLSGTLDRSSALPTLDTSSFLSNHHQEKIVTDFGSASAPIGSFHQSSGAATTTTTNVGGGGGGSAVELDSYPNFPTLESWKVM